MIKLDSSPNRWSVLGRVLLFFFACAFLLAAAAPFMPKLPGYWSQVIFGAVTSASTLILTVLFGRWDKLHLSDVGAAPASRSLTRLVLGFAIGLFIVVLQSCLVGLGGHVRWARTSGGGIAPVAVALLAYLLLACREELAFRGYPLRRLESFFGTWTAQLIVAFVFAIEHRVGGYSWSNAIFGVFVGSLLFGMAALATRGLAVPIGLHAAFNFGQWIIGEKDQSGLWKPIVEQGFETRVDHIGIISYVFVFGSATLAFWWWQHRSKKREDALQSEPL
jgi:hypothetical protein